MIELHDVFFINPDIQAIHNIPIADTANLIKERSIIRKGRALEMIATNKPLEIV